MPREQRDDRVPRTPDRDASVDAEPTVIHRRILLLLAAGFTISTIAKLVFMSERAVHEHIAALKNATGAKNQFALGAEAAKRGWLGDQSS